MQRGSGSVVATIDGLLGLEAELPASVTVTRTSQADCQQRQLIVYLDGQRLATLLHGDSVTRDLPPGPHRVQVSNTLFWKTVDFELRAGEQVYFEAINRVGRFTYPMLLVVGVGPLYVTLTRMA